MTEVGNFDLTSARLTGTIKRRVTFDREYVVQFPEEMLQLVKSLTKRDIVILNCLIKSCGFGNHVRITREKLKELSGVRENHISTSLQTLKRRGAIEIVERDHYRLSHYLVWRGYAAEYQEQLKNYAREKQHKNTAPKGRGKNGASDGD